MTTGLAALFWGVLTFSLLIVIHEGGHFLAARVFGVKVHEFMIGLPGPALRFHGKKTTYGVTAIPLGGYVRIAGMEPGPEDPLLLNALTVSTRMGRVNAMQLAEAIGIEPAEAETLLLTLADWGAVEPVEDDDYAYRALHDPAEADDPPTLYESARSQTYRALTLWQRVLMLCAGVVFNLATAIIVFTVVLSAWGYDVPDTRVEQVLAGSAAAGSGMRSGDVIVSVDGAKISEWPDLAKIIQRHRVGDTVSVIVEREGAQIALPAVLKAERVGSATPKLGVIAALKHVSFTPPQAFVESFSYVGLTFKEIAKLFNPQTAPEVLKNSSSVIGASYMAAEAVKRSPVQYATIVALLSLSLGVINIFPIPPLDGGKIAVEVFEHVRGRQLSRNLSLGMSISGAVLLFALVGYLMYADVLRFIISS